jgi:hypothetical protein
MYRRGLPPYHPLVKQSGFNQTKVNSALRTDAANIIKAGYNLKGECNNPWHVNNLSDI